MGFVMVLSPPNTPEPIAALRSGVAPSPLMISFAISPKLWP